MLSERISCTNYDVAPESMQVLFWNTRFYITIDTVAEFPISESCQQWGVWSAPATPLPNKDLHVNWVGRMLWIVVDGGSW